MEIVDGSGGYAKELAKSEATSPLPLSPLRVMPSSPEDEKLVESKEKRVGFKSFDILDQVGAGAFGRVFKARLKSTNEMFALKVLSKARLTKGRQVKYALAERNVLRCAIHPFVIGLHYAFQTPQYLYLVLDYCEGGDLAMHLKSRGTFTESEARFYMAETVLALEYLHSRNIVFRDMKPDNILLGIIPASKLASHRQRGTHQALRLRTGQGGRRGRRQVAHGLQEALQLLRQSSLHLPRDVDPEMRGEGGRRVWTRSHVPRAADWRSALLQRGHVSDVPQHRIPGIPPARLCLPRGQTLAQGNDGSRSRNRE